MRKIGLSLQKDVVLETAAMVNFEDRIYREKNNTHILQQFHLNILYVSSYFYSLVSS